MNIDPSIRAAWAKEAETERRRCEFVPTPAEIARQAAAIRAEWSDEERMSRAPWSRTEWVVPGSADQQNDLRERFNLIGE